MTTVYDLEILPIVAQTSKLSDDPDGDIDEEGLELGEEEEEEELDPVEEEEEAV